MLAARFAWKNTRWRVGKSALGRASLWVGACAVLMLAIATWRDAEIRRFASDRLAKVQAEHRSFQGLFQASFYFFFEDQFLPGIRSRVEAIPDLKRVRFVGTNGNLIFDSADLKKPEAEAVLDAPAIVEAIRGFGAQGENADPAVFLTGYQVQVIAPAGPFSVLYTFEAASLRRWVAGLGGTALAFLALTAWGLSARPWERWRWLDGRGHVRFTGLRSKFLLTIVLIHLLTAVIVFLTLSELQKREQVARIQRESVLFAQFSTDKVVTDFSNHFYFYYQDRFLPAIRSVLSANENLVGIRILSNRTRSVLFDSRTAPAGPVPEQPKEGVTTGLTEQTWADLRNRGTLVRELVAADAGPGVLSVATTHYNESKEPVFFVEFLFGYQGLAKSIASIRKTLVIDLIPSLGLGLLIAAVFAQLLISPIRRLVAALRRVTDGDYDVSIDLNRADEFGELMKAFNAMTSELKKKKELRKYLSDSTYRQIMEAPDSPEGARLRGTRVPATILFSDIRDFVKHCESLEAEEVTSMLNDYFSEMVEVVYKYGGEVDKFIGDALLAVFYAHDAPSETTTALQAIYCALEMRERLSEFNRRRVESRRPPLEIGVGITHGEIISGPIGAKDRMDFTVIGDVVNLANRIEKLSKLGKHTRIVFSHQVEEKVRGLLSYELLSTERIRGKEEEVKVYELVRIQDLEILFDNLKSNDQALRLRSLDLLGQSRNSAAIPPLIAALKDRDERIRLASVGALKMLAVENDAGVLDALFALAKRDPSMKVVSAAIAGIGKLCTTDRVLELAHLLKSSDERIVANAVEAIGQARDPKGTDLILDQLASVHNRVKANAAMALFAAGHVEVIDTLKPMLMHSNALMRSSAAFAIGELTVLAHKERVIEEWKRKGSEAKRFLGELQECVPMLVTLLRDPEPAVKRQAVIALGKIRDKTAVLPLIDNIDLEKDNKDMIRDIGQALHAIGSHKLVREVLDQLT